MNDMLLGITNAKTVKGESLGYLTGILYLAPYTLSGVNLCPMATPGCAEACLNSAGRGQFNSVKQARLNKAKRFLADRISFIKELNREIKLMQKRAIKHGMKLCIRLNGTSDILWESYKIFNGKNIFEEKSDVQFYDYTKFVHRHEKLPHNYHLSLSMTEKSFKRIKGINNVIVVRNSIVKEYFKRAYKKDFVDGDTHDLRFLDGNNKLVVLTAKGKAKKDCSGFTRDMKAYPITKR